MHWLKSFDIGTEQIAAAFVDSTLVRRCGCRASREILLLPIAVAIANDSNFHIFRVCIIMPLFRDVLTDA